MTLDHGQITAVPGSESRGQAVLSQADAFWREAEILGQALVGHLEYFEALGVTSCPPELLPPLPAPSQEETPSPSQTSASPVRPSAPAKKATTSRPLAPASPKQEKNAVPSDWAPSCPNLGELARQTSLCRGCHLAQDEADPNLRPPLFGRGSEKPFIVFVGPDPSIYAGEKAELLSGIIEKGLKLTPNEYYIASLIRCPWAEDGSQASEKKAILACGPILKRELELLNPQVVLAMGSRPGQYLSGSTNPVGLLRSRTHQMEGLGQSWLRITFGLGHMANSIEIKKEGWKDIQKIIPVLNKYRSQG